MAKGETLQEILARAERTPPGRLNDLRQEAKFLEEEGRRLLEEEGNEQTAQTVLNAAQERKNEIRKLGQAGRAARGATPHNRNN